MTKITGTRVVYACPLCQTAFSHPLNYCSRCPGKLIRREVPFSYKENPKGYFEGIDGSKKYKEWLESHGLKRGEV
jgi:hypothetical protein